jgi:hypothetical protein
MEKPEGAMAAPLTTAKVWRIIQNVAKIAQYNQKRAFPRSLLRKIVRLKDE